MKIEKAHGKYARKAQKMSGQTFHLGVTFKLTQKTSQNRMFTNPLMSKSSKGNQNKKEVNEVIGRP